MNKVEDSPNIALSGWVGVGTTTLTLLLALMLKRPYYPVTQIFRHVYKTLKEDSESEFLNAASEQEFQPSLGHTVDLYIEYLLLNKSGIILESDLAAFRVGKNPKVFSIFLKAQEEVRSKRIKIEGRKNEASVEERDKVLQEEYIKLWDVDIFDNELIERKYNTIIDNSELDLEEELIQALDALEKHQFFTEGYNWESLKKEAPKHIRLYNKKGKESIVKKLEKAKLIVPTEEMLHEIVKVFPEEVEDYPLKMQSIFLGQ